MEGLFVLVASGIFWAYVIIKDCKQDLIDKQTTSRTFFKLMIAYLLIAMCMCALQLLLK
jgi:hypothetical protein